MYFTTSYKILRLLSLSKLTTMIFNKGLTHLGSESYKYSRRIKLNYSFQRCTVDSAITKSITSPRILKYNNKRRKNTKLIRLLSLMRNTIEQLTEVMRTLHISNSIKYVYFLYQLSRYVKIRSVILLPEDIIIKTN